MWPAAANLIGVVAGCHQGLRAAVLACALALGLSGPATAAGPAPPTAAEFERSTDRLLGEPAFDGGTPRRGTGGVGTTSGGLLFPESIYVTLYGAPQLTATVVGKSSPRAAAKKALEQARAYERRSDRDVVPGIDLIGVVANATAGPDGKYRTRQPDTVISTYLEETRAIEGRLMLDIQPGRSSVLTEIVALKKWIAEPDVDVGIDPEWNVGPRGVPGKDAGSITADEINRASLRLNTIVENENLPPKVLLVHQFTQPMIKNREEIKQRDDVQVLLNFDGIGSRKAKVAGYQALATEGLFNGFSIFLSLDSRIIQPAFVLGLLPTVDFLLYQ